MKCYYAAWDCFAEEGGKVFQVAGFTQCSSLGGHVCFFIGCEVAVAWHPLDTEIAYSSCPGFDGLIIALGSLEFCFTQDPILFGLKMFSSVVDLV